MVHFHQLWGQDSRRESQPKRKVSLHFFSTSHFLLFLLCFFFLAFLSCSFGSSNSGLDCKMQTTDSGQALLHPDTHTSISILQESRQNWIYNVSSMLHTLWFVPTTNDHPQSHIFNLNRKYMDKKATKNITANNRFIFHSFVFLLTHFVFRN